MEAATQEAGIINHRRSSTAADTINHHLNSNTVVAINSTAVDTINHRLSSSTAVAINSTAASMVARRRNITTNTLRPTTRRPRALTLTDTR